MGMKGKFVRLDGQGQAIFGSQKKPEWFPMAIGGQFDASSLVPGEYYDIELIEKRLVGASRLAPRTGDAYQAASQGSGHSQPSPEASGPPAAIPLSSLMASATGFAKSAMESGICKTWAEAAHAGIAWGERWGDVPPAKAEEMARAASSPMPEARWPDDDEPPY